MNFSAMLRAHPAEIGGQPDSGKQDAHGHDNPSHRCFRALRREEPEKNESNC
jgi:hypothetical protein